MSRYKNISNSTFYSNKPNKLNNVGAITGKVVYVHLDNSKSAPMNLPSELSDKVEANEPVIGYCKIVLTGKDTSYNVKTVNSYPPANPDEGIPLVNEIVQLIEIGGTLHYKRIPDIDINAGSAYENALLEGNPSEEKSSNQASSYSETSATGIANNSNSEDGDREQTIGEYFTKQQINPLRLYEGDKLIQSRFGQSIRFSGYNNENNEFSPTIILRNRQSDKSVEDLKEYEVTEEDIVNDGSTIVLASGQYEIPFSPGNEEVTLETDDNVRYYEAPELKGTDQILMNSGRIVLSSKDSEMIFFSKGNYSFISDGKLTIDNGFDGAEMDFNGEVRITTNDNPTYILGEGSKGKIYLNTETEDEPIVKGATLLKLMEELIDAINAQVFSTPSGPTKVGPNNAGDFKTIKSKLDTFLSKVNFTDE
jgi:hypothetical protein